MTRTSPHPEDYPRPAAQVLSDDDAELHPVGQVIASVIEDGPNNTAVLSEAGLDFVRRALDEYLDAGEALMRAVDTVLVAAHVIEMEQGSRAVAERLVTLVDRPEVIAAMRQITEAAEARRASQVARSAERFSRFAGHDGATAPPADDPERPKGAVRLGDLAFPKRL